MEPTSRSTKRILPGGSRRSGHFLHSYISNHVGEVPSVDGVSIAQHISRRRSEEHTSELQSPDHLVCRLLLEKKKKNQEVKTHTCIVITYDCNSKLTQ